MGTLNWKTLEPTMKSGILLGLALVLSVVLHVASLGVFVRYYAGTFVFEFGHGFTTLYWGGDREMRNSYIFNVGEWPLHPDTVFAGKDWTVEQRWEIYGPHYEFTRSAISDRIQSRGVLGALGYALPQIRRDETKAASMLIPMGSFALVTGLGIFLWYFRGRIWQTAGKEPMSAAPPPPTSTVYRGLMPAMLMALVNGVLAGSDLNQKIIAGVSSFVPIYGALVIGLWLSPVKKWPLAKQRIFIWLLAGIIEAGIVFGPFLFW
jgi:hypothetical protein